MVGEPYTNLACFLRIALVRTRDLQGGLAQDARRLASVRCKISPLTAVVLGPGVDLVHREKVQALFDAGVRAFINLMMDEGGRSSTITTTESHMHAQRLN